MGWIAKIFGSEQEEEPRYIVPQLPELPAMRFQQEEMPQEYPQAPEQNEVKEVVFVRLDKFESSEKSLQDVKSKLQEMESNIRAVDRINQVEDDRLFSWGKDLEKVKSYLIKIDEKIFNQI